MKKEYAEDDNKVMKEKIMEFMNDNKKTAYPIKEIESAFKDELAVDGSIADLEGEGKIRFGPDIAVYDKKKKRKIYLKSVMPGDAKNEDCKENNESALLQSEQEREN